MGGVTIWAWLISAGSSQKLVICIAGWWVAGLNGIGKYFEFCVACSKDNGSVYWPNGSTTCLKTS